MGRRLKRMHALQAKKREHNMSKDVRWCDLMSTSKEVVACTAQMQYIRETAEERRSRKGGIIAQ
jgi:hypothetical protein